MSRGLWNLILSVQFIISIPSQDTLSPLSQRIKVVPNTICLHDLYSHLPDVAKAIIRRFTDAMANHDHNFQGYQLTTFANQANYIGVINHQNFDSIWRNVRLGGGTRVMTGWQKVKDLHFQKHSESATHHPVYGWQAGPQTPMLRLLLLLDGEATDMDEFELDLLG